MKSRKIRVLLLFAGLAASCGGGGSSTSSTNSGGGGGNGGSGGTGAASNVLAITVNDPSYPNKPTVSVTVCTPGTSNCQTINDILLDTGDYGLRIFQQTPLNVSLLQVTVGSGSLAECVTYADGSGEWGPVKTADVVLGEETASDVPIQVIDVSYFASAIPAACKPPNVIGLDQGPGSAGYNGILGVGLFAADCGQGCTSTANNGIYFACSGSSCVGTTVPLASQVQNPVALLNQDSNGVVVQLPSVPLGGVQSVTGQLILGIGTRSNNIPSAMTTYPADSIGEFTTSFDNILLSDSFIDSGSNGLFFNSPSSLLPLCSSPDQGWYCPQSTQSLNATNTGATGEPSGPVMFEIGNAASLFSNASNSVFSELGGPAPAGYGFDWGLPFFFGRAVFVGIEGTSSILGSGPYWAY
jgi:hypothetical protein